jgi:hypothetical protein
MSSVYVQDRKFTYTRLSLQYGELEEEAIAHLVVSTPLNDKFILSFFNIAFDGYLQLIKVVHDVVKFDAGKQVTE